ncbi:histidinol-phosphatase HisJ [Gracilibacillus caseinilyticus]|uniref:Histidinol-phosphatase n=1 Tax=Gracilibacillus caseinilyticus TaxID=2932256 RepID=A0ABY4ETR0_9BACI|nr:histidinol-phosphatase HisJ [Gracilibacillus caseinilyticus]UOQ47715.1 histidinol-phosphatase HisJ [Gracilibacillus caseinilyticus]
MNITGDYHVHTAFCPHGSNDKIEAYIEQAINKGLTELSFTEHAPLPKAFTDPTPDKDSAMKWADLDGYIQTIEKVKKDYQAQLKINVGFEVDYIEGYESAITSFLNDYGSVIDDAILSVHMLKTNTDDYVCVDFSVEEFARIIQLFGSVEAVYDSYYQTLEKAIVADLGPFKPNRIGHLTLIHKYQRKYAVDQGYQLTIERLLDLMKKNKLELDVNTSGLYKEECLELYPPQAIVDLALQKGIPLKPGSDSHTAKTITRGFNKLLPLEN